MTQKKHIIWTDRIWDLISPSLRETILAQHDFVRGADNLRKAEIAFGQPDPAALQTAANLRWIHLSSAGHSKFDGDDTQSLLKERGIIMTNSSKVYAEPCAEHLLAMILSIARRLPQAVENQVESKEWNHAEERKETYLLKEQKVLMLGFGAIARRLAQLLQPLDMQISALRRHSSQEPDVTIVSQDDLPKVLIEADHIVDILPENDSTKHFVDGAFLQKIKPGAVFYNIGRGTTVDQAALIAALRKGNLAAAYLDVTTPEPLPPDNPLWDTPHCYITPHSAGGHHDEFDRLVLHFLEKLNRYENGEELSGRLYSS